MSRFQRRSKQIDQLMADPPASPSSPNPHYLVSSSFSLSSGSRSSEISPKMKRAASVEIEKPRSPSRSHSSRPSSSILRNSSRKMSRLILFPPHSPVVIASAFGTDDHFS